jgi:hypothetical protein
MYRLPLLLLLAACSDYDLNPKQDDEGLNGDTGLPTVDTGTDTTITGETDSDPTTCTDRSYPAGTLARNDACFEEGPTVGTFTPVVEWTRQTFATDPGSTQVMMMPAVGSLTDDDGDGDADEDDVPDIVFITYGSSVTTGDIRVVSGDGGAEILTIAGSRGGSVQGQGGVALGDIDNDGWTDIVAALTTGVGAWDHNGNLLWQNTALTGNIVGTCDNPAISDMDGDGNPEIVIGRAIISNTGVLLGRGTSGMAGVDGANVGTVAVAVDIDGDGLQEVVTGNALYNRDGTLKARNSERDGYVAVGNFDSDANGEIVVSSQGRVRLQDDDMRVLCSAAIPGAGSSYYGGPPTVADFDGDGEAEFALASGSRYSVFERDCTVKWQAITQDASSGNTGSAVFDFEGDGIAEAVYGDETRLWVFAGPDGSVKLSSTEHSNATWLEYPTIADVDGDGQAEIVVANTQYTQNFSGISVFGDADNSWMRGRKIWNQHAYHITNVDDDGGIPRVAARNWDTYNNFRSGDLAPGGGYSGPDLVTTVEGVCTDECAEDRLLVWVSVGNAGYEDVDVDVELKLVGEMDDGTTRILGSPYTVTDTIAAGTTLAAVQFTIDPVPTGLLDIHAAIDDGNDSARSVVGECAEDNNEDRWNESLCAP